MVYDVYPQLNLDTSNYRRFNDSFTMYITRTLKDALHMGISIEAMDLIKKNGFWFIQFPKFTYIRIHGFAKVPYRLPRYHTNKFILIELKR